MKKTFFLSLFGVMFAILLSGCESAGNNIGTYNTNSVVSVSINIELKSNIVFAKENLDIYIDNKEQGTLQNGNTYQNTIPLTVGKHKLKLGRGLHNKTIDFEVRGAGEIFQFTAKNHMSSVDFWMDYRKNTYEIMGMEIPKQDDGNEPSSEQIDELLKPETKIIWDWIVTIFKVILIFIGIAIVFMTGGLAINAVFKAISMRMLAGLLIFAALCVYTVISGFQVFNAILTVLYLLALIGFFVKSRGIEPIYKKMKVIQDSIDTSWAFIISYIFPATVLAYPVIIEQLPFGIHNLYVYLYIYMIMCIALPITMFNGSADKVKQFHALVKRNDYLSDEDMEKFTAEYYSNDESDEDKEKKRKETAAIVKDFVTAGIIEEISEDDDIIYRKKAGMPLTSGKVKDSPRALKYMRYTEKLDSLKAEINHGDIEMRNQLDGLKSITVKIYEFTEKHNTESRKTDALIDYYFEAVFKLTMSYIGLSENESSETRKKIYGIINNITTAFNNHYINLYENKVLDIETDISAFEAMMKQDGLIVDDIKSNIRNI